MNTPDLNQYSVEELELMNQDLMNQRRTLVEKQRAIAQVLDSKRKDEAVAKEIAAIKARHGVDLKLVE